jgi:rRNA maturation endonuclease Nob1
MNEPSPTPMRSWYCQGCGTEIKRAELEHEKCYKCGGSTFSLQPRLHTTNIKITEFDKRLMSSHGIKLED